ncbi:MAG: methyltransferase, partial [Verrucomicrobiaceae bacterium]|nr:methyltransferase [Verrucomicrobiaceae bacterium]
MHSTPPRAIAEFALNLHRHLISQIVDALADIFIYGYYSDKVIERRFKLHPKWGARDRKQVAETIYEIVRWWRWHWHLAGLPDGDCLIKEKITLERIWQVWGAYWISKTGSAASLYEVERMDVEAVQARAAEIVAPAIRASLPDWLNDLGKKELGHEWPDLLRALNRPADVFLRANTLKIQTKPLSINLEKEGIENKLLPDVPDAIQLVKRQSIFASSAFRAGLFEVQDAASQQIAPFLDVSPGQRVIDACAGAGGKALHLACLMKNKGKIVALDIHEWKLKELR